jgi:hypothetical protein
MKVNISAALVVLICFFLPWLQVSCGASRETLTGVDLARQGHSGLWLIPILMLAVILLNSARKLREQRAVATLVSFVAGLVSAYLMNRERLRAEDSSGLLQVNLTVWFWLGLLASIALIAAGALQFLKRPKPS